MDLERLEHIINVIAKGDTTAAEGLFNKPGGRKFLESIVVTVLCNLPGGEEEKEALFVAFLKALDKMEKRIAHQKQGQRILSQVYYN